MGTAKMVVFQSRAVDQRACVLASALYSKPLFSIAIDKRCRYVAVTGLLFKVSQINPEIG